MGGKYLRGKKRWSNRALSITLFLQYYTRIRQIIAGDLKPNLLILRSVLEGHSEAMTALKDVPVKDLEFLNQKVTQLLTYVEQQQDQAVQPFPLFWGQV